jgi:hypothetical protein
LYSFLKIGKNQILVSGKFDGQNNGRARDYLAQEA